MMMLQRTRAGRWLCHLGAISALAGLHLAGGARVYGDDSHPVLARFPSRAELQQRIDEIRRDHPPRYEAARQDFDLAIRSRWTLQGPKWPGKPLPTPIVKPKLTLSALMPRNAWANYIREIDEMEGGDELAQFYRHHLDELCFEDTPELRAVLVDILLNGWDDWSEWGDEKPSVFREKFPDLHRVYAIRELVRLDYNDVNGVLLELFADGDVPPYLWTEVAAAVGDLGAHFDKLEFTADVAYSSDDVRVRERLAGYIQHFADRASKDPRSKSFWEPYLGSPIPELRFAARKAHELPIPDVIERLYAQQEWVAANDSDPTRRKEMARVIRRREILRKRQEGTLTPEEWEQWQRESRSP
ncbi:MAG: hypothetical protein JSU86_13835 [Phycisphaerales bacterium]|nr:MAG: hypothetical protein JSU86_13835 [Phycisphaerales bacterium]